MNVYVCTDHEGHWPVGVASVVVAPTEDHARLLLDAALKTRGLKSTPYTFQQIDTNYDKAYVLLDGDY